MAEKVIMMKLKVDLDCPKCYKKVKKALRKFSQIRDQLFDEKTNTIIIKVVCYDPERFMNKLCYKGDGSIKSIVILEPPKPQPQQKPKEPEKVQAPVQAQVPVQVQAPVLVQVPTPPMMPRSQQAYHCGPYYEAQQNECYGRPIYDSWGGRPHPHPQCCHEVSNQQSCSIM